MCKQFSPLQLENAQHPFLQAICIHFNMNRFERQQTLRISSLCQLFKLCMKDDNNANAISKGQTSEPRLCKLL